MMSVLPFLLPDDDLPSLNALACMIETDHSHEAYALSLFGFFLSLQAD
jgi:hypothetical protein